MKSCECCLTQDNFARDYNKWSIICEKVRSMNTSIINVHSKLLSFLHSAVCLTANYIAALKSFKDIYSHLILKRTIIANCILLYLRFNYKRHINYIIIFFIPVTIMKFRHVGTNMSTLINIAHFNEVTVVFNFSH